jgi:1-acyl-sn-glycerol-3-phosphate acyltransferase
MVLFKVLFCFKAFGKKNIPKKGGFILASNHTSYLDPIALGIACTRKLSFMAKQELFCNLFSTWFMSRLGVFPLKRDSADVSALKEAMQRLKNGGALVLFPEGSRRFDGVSLGPQPGIGFLVSKLNVPVIPAFIKGTDDALPKGAKFIRLKKVSVRFGKQIFIEGRMPYQDIAERIMKDIRLLG